MCEYSKKHSVWSPGDVSIAILLVCIMMVTGYVMMVVGVCGIYHDDGIYVITAKALAQGHGYRLINLPDSPLQTKYPIVYPALLAVVWKFWPSFPANLLAMQLLTLLFGAMALGLTYLYVTTFSYFSRALALSAGLLCATSPAFLHFGTNTLSEMPFAFCTIVSMYALDGHIRTPSSSRLAQSLIGISLALPFLTRAIGGIFVLIGLSMLYFLRRPLRWVVLGAAFAAVPWCMWMIVAPSWGQPIATAYYTNYLAWWHHVGGSHLGRVLVFNFLGITITGLTTGVGFLRELHQLAPWIWPALILLGMLALIRNGERGASFSSATEFRRRVFGPDHDLALASNSLLGTDPSAISMFLPWRNK